MTNIAQTNPNATDPQLRTRFYLATTQEVAQAVQNVVPQLKTYGRHWQVIETSSQNETITIRCHVPVLVFTDDLVVSIRETAGHTQLDIRSQSRVGKGDFGENKRHLLQLLQRLDAVLPISNSLQ